MLYPLQIPSSQQFGTLQPAGACYRDRAAQPGCISRHRKTGRSCATLQAEASEVTIRRLPPDGISLQPCGPMAFKVPETDTNKPQNILEEIVWYKAQEIARQRDHVPLPRLQMQIRAAPPTRNFIAALRNAQLQTSKPGLIAEVKKASPSKGIICQNFDPVQIAKAYETGGAACLSVLTDSKYFQGSFEYMRDIRAAGVQCPLLCKEFIVEAYQILHARASGADCVLLIAAVLPNKDLEALVKVAAKLGMQCLVEVHTIAELERVLRLSVLEESCMLGINNRDLQTFTVDLNNNKVIMESAAGQEALQRGLLFAGESGIVTPEDVQFVQDVGCGAILVGESLVKQRNIEAAVRKLLSLDHALTREVVV